MKRIIYVILLVLVTNNIFADTKIIAHRGYWKSGAAQNGVEALLKADSIGVYASECDVWLTKDGRLIMFHDKYYLKDGARHLICDTNSKKIRNLELVNGEHPVSLREFLNVFKKTNNIKLIIELKSNGDEKLEKKQVLKTLRLVKDMKLISRVEYIAFSKNICDELVRQQPNVKVSYLDGKLSPEQIKQLGYSGIDYHYSWIEKYPQWVDDAHKLGLTVNVWTVNKIETMSKMIEIGVDFITTDEPDKLMNLLGN